MCALLINPLYMKAILLLTVIIASSAFADMGVASFRQYTVRTKNTVCAVDVAITSNGLTKITKSCFKV